MQNIYVLMLASRLCTLGPQKVTHDAALNEAYQIAIGDGLYSTDLVNWNHKTGAVTLNLIPTLPLEGQAVYSRSNPLIDNHMS